MSQLPSPSPYAYLDDLTPAERQAAIARRQHEQREEWCDDARRARDYQARVAELEAALEPFAAYAPNENLDKAIPDGFVFSTGSPLAKKQLTFGHLRRARAALRNRI
jgi:hypothetical protein